MMKLVFWPPSGGRTGYGVQGRSSALSYLESILPDASQTTVESAVKKHPEPQGFVSDLQAPQAKFEPGASEKTTTWERFVLDHGIELHIRADRKQTLRTGGLKRLVERLFKALHHQGD